MVSVGYGGLPRQIAWHTGCNLMAAEDMKMQDTMQAVIIRNRHWAIMDIIVGVATHTGVLICAALFLTL